MACVPDRWDTGGIGRVPCGVTGGIGRVPVPVGGGTAGMARVPDGGGVVPGFVTAVVRLGVACGGVIGCVTAAFNSECSGREAGRIGDVRCALCGVVSWFSSGGISNGGI